MFPFHGIEERQLDQKGGDFMSSTGPLLFIAFKVTSSLKLESFLICHTKRLQLIITVVPSELAILLLEIKINISLSVFFDSAKKKKESGTCGTIQWRA